MDEAREGTAPDCLRERECAPPGVDVLLVGLLEAVGGDDCAVDDRAPLRISDPIHRGDDILEEPRRLEEDTLDHVGGRMAELLEGGDRGQVSEVVEDELDLGEGDGVVTHGRNATDGHPGWFAASAPNHRPGERRHHPVILVRDSDPVGRECLAERDLLGGGSEAIPHVCTGRGHEVAVDHERRPPRGV